MNIAFALAVATVPAVGFTQVITFEDLAQQTTGHFSSAGFDFYMNGLGSWIFQGQLCSPECPDNGTKMAVVPWGGNSFLSMSSSDGGSFGLSSFDGAGTFNFNKFGRPDLIPSFIDVIGYRVGGGTVSQSFAIDKNSNLNQTLNFTKYSFTGFSNLESVTFFASGSRDSVYNGFTLDNISVSAVPEPETHAMMLAGLSLMGAIARRRKAKQA